MFNNIKALIESEGADWHDVVRTTCYLTDFRYYDEFNEVRNAFYEQALEVSTNDPFALLGLGNVTMHSTRTPRRCCVLKPC